MTSSVRQVVPPEERDAGRRDARARRTVLARGLLLQALHRGDVLPTIINKKKKKKKTKNKMHICIYRERESMTIIFVICLMIIIVVIV